MKKILFVLLIGFLSNFSYAKEISVVAASATSSTEDSSDIGCLLKPNCKGSWQAASRDSGVDEGIYLQFSDDVPLYSIELDIEDDKTDPAMILYLNGKTTGPNDVVYINTRERKGLGKYRTYVFKGRDEENFQNSLNTNAHSVFIKLDKSYMKSKRPIFKSIRFYRRVLTGDPDRIVTELIQFKLPIIIKSEVEATSILPPDAAYNPANLFDSRYDFAWSTEGSKVSGIGEKINVKFSTNVNISGLMVWNGYQRSQTHFEKNGRVKSLLLSDNEGNSETVSLTSVFGMQEVKFSKVLLNVSQLSMEIKEIFKGSVYKDVLISELRFLDEKGNIILPLVPLSKMSYNKNLGDFIDRSWSTFLHGLVPGEAECGYTCNNKRIRLRSNGSFVIYLDFGSNDDGSQTANVLEGNWADEQGVLRIFGKRYTTELRSSDYIQADKTKSVPTAKIFQSNFMVTRFNELSKAKQTSVFHAMVKSRPSISDSGYGFSWEQTCNISASGKDGQLFAKSYQGLLNMTRQYIEKINPYYIESSVVTDLFMPTDEVSSCGGC